MKPEQVSSNQLLALWGFGGKRMCMQLRSGSHCAIHVCNEAALSIYGRQMSGQTTLRSMAACSDLSLL